MTAPSDYLTPWRLRPDRLRLYAPGREDWRPGETPPPPPPPPTGRVVLANMFGKSVFTEPPTGNDRDQLVYGVDMPTRETTGCTDTSILAVLGPTTYAGTGTLIENKWFQGKVNLTGDGYTFKNCWFSGDPVAVSPNVQCTATTSANNKFIDCTFWPQNPQWDNPGIKGWRFTVERCYFRGCTDGIQHLGRGSDGTATGDYTTVDQDVHIFASLFELGCYLCPDPGAAGGLTDNCSHLDVGFQCRGGRKFTFKGNMVLGYMDPTIGQGGLLPEWMPSGTHLVGNKYATIDDPSIQGTSCIMLSPISGQIDGMLVEQNWMTGGVCIINFAGHNTAGTALGGITVRGNRVADDQRKPISGLGPGTYWLAPPSLAIALTGNVKWNLPRVGTLGWDPEQSYQEALTATVSTTPANTRTTGSG